MPIIFPLCVSYLCHVMWTGSACNVLGSVCKQTGLACQ